MKMTNENQLVKTLSIKDISEINRVLGIIEGLQYAIQDAGVADGLLNAIERIEAVVNKED
jgi:hypothetical protein